MRFVELEHRWGASCACAVVVMLVLALNASPADGAPLADPPAAPPATAAVSTGTDSAQRFPVLEYRVIGNTVLPVRDVERAVYPFLGVTQTMQDVEAARVALEKSYHDHGFGTVFVDIPEQAVQDGVVRLHVTEGRLRQVAVSGTRYFSGRQIRAQLPAAQSGAVPNLPELSNELTALNRQTPDRVVVPVLRAGPAPGTVDLGLKVQDHLPLHGSLELNNQQTPDTRPLRAMGSLSYDNLFGELDRFGLQYQTAPQDPSEVKVFVANYVGRPSPDSQLGFLFIDSNTNVAALGTLGVLGKGQVYELRYTDALSASALVLQSVSLAVDYKDFKQNILTAASGGLNTPISYVNWSAGYTASGRHAAELHSWQLQDWSFDVTGNLGVRGVANRPLDFADKRYLAPPNYFYVHLNGSLTIELPWHFSAALALAGQYSVDPLVNYEQFTAGGAYSVRGYLESEELGDTGVRSSLQLNSMELRLFAGALRANGFLFLDAARVSTIDALPGEPTSGNLRSAGAGLGIVLLDQFSGALTWADPFVAGAVTRRDVSRWLFSVRGSW